jgi:3-dehydroquinate synthetase/shikimate kinase
MPGSGKSAAGRILARLLDVPFVDLDELYEERFGETPAAAIRRGGETRFRAREARLLLALLEAGRAEELNMLAVTGDHKCKRQNAKCKVRNGHASWLSATIDHRPSTITNDRRSTRFCLESRGGLQRPASVIACGGGTLVRAPLLRQALARAFVVHLAATPETLAARLKDASRHPLLRGEDFLGAIRALAEARAGAYARAHAAVATDGLTPVRVALAIREVLALRPGGGRTAGLPASFHPIDGGREAFLELGRRTVPVWIAGKPGLERLAEMLLEVAGEAPRIPVVDEWVWKHYGRRLEATLGRPALGKVLLPRGEAAKRLAHLEPALEAMLGRGADRSSVLVAVGGGSTLDAAGFCAAVFMRGVPVVYVCTTLLAAVDAGIGGKTAMDLPSAKNMVGTFSQPAGVLIPLDIIADEVKATGGLDGAAEFIKTALLAGLEEREILSFAGRRGGLAVSRLPEAIELAARFKMDVVAADELDRNGRRAVLNLGHSFAHMAEAASGYRLSHGRAVAWGLVVSARVSVRLGLADPGLPEMVVRINRRFGLWPPPEGLVRPDSLRLRDKKQAGRSVTLVLLRRPGVVEQVPMPVQRARNLLVNCAEIYSRQDG